MFPLLAPVRVLPNRLWEGPYLARLPLFHGHAGSADDPSRSRRLAFVRGIRRLMREALLLRVNDDITHVGWNCARRTLLAGPCAGQYCPGSIVQIRCVDAVGPPGSSGPHPPKGQSIHTCGTGIKASKPPTSIFLRSILEACSPNSHM